MLDNMPGWLISLVSFITIYIMVNAFLFIGSLINNNRRRKGSAR